MQGVGGSRLSGREPLFCPREPMLLFVPVIRESP
jgi:hypothetical protein